jgi:alkanesulfonate monooxygenase SsuD/methylene tetrahydromethanopterin reductase-like flavin-dependent oxidoreductase (luciferase family)
MVAGALLELNPNVANGVDEAIHCADLDSGGWAVNFHGQEIYVAAMGPRALQVTGELADGTLPHLAGPRTIEEFIAPTITKVTAEAGRPRPRIIAMVPVAVTDDVDTARDEAAGKPALYDTVRSYRAVMDREGVAGAADLAVIGSALSVSRRLRSYVEPVQRTWCCHRSARSPLPCGAFGR